MSAQQGVDLFAPCNTDRGFLSTGVRRADAFVAARNSIKAFFDKQGTDKFSITEIPDASDSNHLPFRPATQSY